MSLRNILLVIPIIFVLALGGFIGHWAATPTTANAQIGLLPFGGMILSVVYCYCSMGILLVVGPPVPGTYIFQLGRSIPFPFGQVYRPGPWLLGTWTPGGICSTGVFCTTVIPAMGTIGIVGTSL